MAVSVFALLILTFVLLRSFIAQYHSSNAANFDLIDTPHLPEEPVALIAPDHIGKKKWTVWIPPTKSFPLRPQEYADICAQADEVQRELGRSRWFGTKKKSYYGMDSSFVDVQDALEVGLLPPMDEKSKQGSIAEEMQQENLGGESVCERSLTFVMETTDAGMGNSMLALWLAYGLAKKENRSFFVDDTHWYVSSWALVPWYIMLILSVRPYGNFSTYFKPPPAPKCQPPSANFRLPCPASASHLVISAATFPFSFGPMFLSQFLDTSRSHEQHHQIFSLVRTGYEALFHLAHADDAAYVNERTTGKVFQEVNRRGGVTIGLHVRRGDLHPWEEQFERDYLPLTTYMDEARDILISRYEHEPTKRSGSPLTNDRRLDAEKDLFSHLTPFSTFAKSKFPFEIPSKNSNHLIKRHGAPGLMASKVLLASDDPLVYYAPEVSSTMRAQDRIVLASKSDLVSVSTADKQTSWLDTVSGWEGGFFKDVFFGLGRGHEGTRKPPQRSRLVGRSTEVSQNHAYFAAPAAAQGIHPALAQLYAHHGQWHPAGQYSRVPESPSPDAMRMREIVGRAYLLDLAVLGKTDSVVCAVSSASCRVLGIMLGWDKVVGGMWRNVDGEFGWSLRGVVYE
jgi:hypothetical protein